MKIRTLLACCVTAASIASMVTAAPASATNEAYSCGECAQVNGHENYISNNESYNFSGEGFCDAAYDNVGGTYFLAFEKCYSSGKGIVLCSTVGEFWGHGQTRRYYAKYEYNLWGRQDNYKYCG
jgi:hypothetical protein